VLRTGDLVTVIPDAGGAPIEAVVQVHPVGLIFVAFAAATTNGIVRQQLLDEEEDERWARGHGADVAAALLLAGSVY
jgi:hypothetical protein